MIVTWLLYDYYVIIRTKNHVMMIPLLHVMQRVGLPYYVIIRYYASLLHLVLLLHIITYFSLQNLQMEVTLKALK